MYVFTRWRRQREGWGPEVDGWVVASSSSRDRRSEWALVKTRLESGERLPRARPVPERLASLLDWSERFPPALAIARDQLERFGSPAWEPDALADRLSWLLSVQLRAQRRSRYVLVQPAREEVGYLSDGEFVWALGTTRSERTGEAGLAWVSGDYEVYTNRLSDFRNPRSIARTLGPWRLPRPRWR